MKAEKKQQPKNKREKMLRQATVCRLLREWQGVTIKDLAAECDVSVATISRCENGVGSLGLAEFFLKELCRKAGWSWALFQRLVFEDDGVAV